MAVSYSKATAHKIPNSSARSDHGHSYLPQKSDQLIFAKLDNK